MARINLRDYLREIDDLIDNGRTDEAIAHSRYILELYPKHIETYRLLGKAYLENQRYTDAADVLQRVLSSIPDDFISHLGMSIIREDEGNFNAAIWHMERAFEMQPSNAAIQEELRRLYGRRDGLEPTKIHLTRGALARMYAKGDLYEQAIAEIKATLAQEPQRTDLQVLLARMYAQIGQQVESVKICSNILQSHPNCKEAIIILGEILPETERAEEAVNYHRRLQALDPYAAHISPSAPSSDQVPDNVITLERLEWTPGETGDRINTRPDWAASLGVEIAASSIDEDVLQDWLTESTDSEETPAFMSESIDIETPSSMENLGEPLSQGDQENELSDAGETEDKPLDRVNQIPDFMQSAGWEFSEESSEESPGPFTFEDEFDEIDDEIESAQIPGWLQSMSPLSKDTDIAEQAVEEESPEGESVTWLDEQTPGATDSVVTWLQAKNQIEPEDDASLDDGIPDWLRDLGEESIPETPQEDLSELELQAPELTQPSSDESVVPKLGLTDDSDEEGVGALPTEDIPEWLSDLSGEAPSFEIQEQADDIEVEIVDFLQPDEAEPTIEDEIPDWLSAFDEETAIEESLEAPSYMRGTTPARTDQSKFAPSVEEDATDLTVALGEDTDEILDLSVSKAGETIMEDQEKIPELSPEDEDAALAWLESLAAKHGVDEQELLTTPDERQSSPPDWVQQLAAESEPKEQVDSVQDISMQTDSDEAGDLIFSSDAETVSKAELESSDQTIEEPEGIPDWLLDLVEDSTPIEEEPVSPESEVGFPQGEQEAEPTEDTISDWLQDLADETVVSATESPLEEPPTTIGDTQPTQVAEEEKAVLLDLDSELEDIPELKPSIETTTSDQFDEITIQPEDEAETIPVLDKDLPDWLKDLEIADEDKLTVQETDQQVEPEIPEWITTEEITEEPLETPELSQVLEAEKAEEEPEIPKWITTEAIKEEPLETLEPSQAVDVEETEEEPEIPEWITTEEIMEEPPETPEPSEMLEAEETDEEPEIPEWTIAEEIVEQPLESPEPSLSVEAVEAEEEPEIPEWINADEAAEEISEMVDESEQIQPIDTEVTPEQVDEALVEVPAEKELPSPVNLNTASFKALERLPSIGPVIAQTIIDHRQTHGFFTDVDSIQDVPGIGPKTLKTLRDYLYVEHEEETTPMPESPEDKTLNEGRVALESGNVVKAYDYYSKLIEEEQLLDKVIDDLKEAQYRFPVEVSIYELLGDAFMRSDQLQEAIDTYTKAEELLA